MKKKQILHDMFIQICMEEIDRQKHIAIGAPIPKIISESEKSLSIYGKVPLLGGLANIASLINQAYETNQEQIFAQRINKIFESTSNDDIKLLLSKAITKILNSFTTTLNSYDDRQEIEKIAILAYKKLFDFLITNDLKEEKLNVNKIIEIIRQQNIARLTGWPKNDVFYVNQEQDRITENFSKTKKLKIFHDYSQCDDFVDNDYLDDLAFNSEHFRIDRIEKNIDQLQQVTQKHDYLLGSTKVTSEVKDLYFYNAKTVTYYFVGRNSQLNQIHEYFAEHQNGIQVIGGLGGIGKTQIALQYIHLYKSEYNNRIRYFEAKTKESIEIEFKEFAEAIDISTSNIKSEEIRELVKRELESSIEHSLLVFDNLLDYNLIKDYLPNSGAKYQHHIIITTENTLDYNSLSVFMNINIISLKQLSDDESYEYIKHNIEIDSRLDAIELSNLFSNIPLGLSHSVAFIKTNKLQIKTYLKEHKAIKNNLKQLPEILLHSKSDPHLDNIYITLLMSLETISEFEPKAFMILQICGYLNTDKIPDYLFDALFEREIEKSKTISILEGYSLISTQKEMDINFIHLHRILQEVIRSRIINGDHVIMIKAMELVHQQLETNTDRVITLKKRQTLLQHSISLIDHYNKVTNIPKSICELNFEMSHKMRKFIKINEKKSEITDISEEQRLKYENYKIIDLNKIAVRLYNDCGNVYLSLLQLDKAEEYYQQALQMGGLIYGKSSEIVATILSNIAGISQIYKKYQYAIDQYENILSIYQTQEIVNFQKIAMIISKIAYVHLMMRENKLAMDKYNQALEIYQDNNINNSCIEDIADTIYGIANVHLALGEYQEALDQYNNASAIYRQLFGNKSAKEAEVINVIGNTYRIFGEYQNAIDQYNLAMEINKNIYHEQHLSVAINMRSICKIYYLTKRYEQALAMYELVLPIFKEVFSEEHLMVGKIIYEIGNIYKAQNQYTKALEYFNKALHIYQNTHGIKHKETIGILNNIEIIQKNLEESQESLQIIKRSTSTESKSFSQTQDGFSASLDWLKFIEHIENSQQSNYHSQSSNGKALLCIASSDSPENIRAFEGFGCHVGLITYEFYSSHHQLLKIQKSSTSNNFDISSLALGVQQGIEFAPTIRYFFKIFGIDLPKLNLPNEFWGLLHLGIGVIKLNQQTDLLLGQAIESGSYYAKLVVYDKLSLPISDNKPINLVSFIKACNVDILVGGIFGIASGLPIYGAISGAAICLDKHHILQEESFFHNSIRYILDSASGLLAITAIYRQDPLLYTLGIINAVVVTDITTKVIFSSIDLSLNGLNSPILNSDYHET